jgi:hypothetical protein
MAGTRNTSIKSYDFYRDSTLGASAVTTTFIDVRHEFVDDLDGGAFLSYAVMVANDHATSDIFFSWDGVNVHGRVTPGTNASFENKRKRKIYLRGAAGGEGYRLWAW